MLYEKGTALREHSKFHDYTQKGCLFPREKIRRESVYIWVSLHALLPRRTARLRCADLIGPLTLALKLQDHPGEGTQGDSVMLPCL